MPNTYPLRRGASALPLWLLASSALLPAASTLAADAGSPDPTVQALTQRVQELERKLEQLTAGTTPGAQVAAPAQTQALVLTQASAPQAVNVSAGENGFGIHTADGSYGVQIGSTTQFDLRSFLGDAPTGTGSDTFLFRKARLSFDFSLGNYVDLRLMPDFASNTTTLVDAYIDLKPTSWLTLRAGKQKGPIGLERLQKDSETVFIERTLPNELVPNRDIGLAALGKVANNTISYEIGIFNGTADGRDASATDVDNHKEVEGRLFFEPFHNTPGYLQGLGFGVSGSHGDKDSNTVGENGALPQYLSAGQNIFFQYRSTVYAAGTHDRASVNGYYYVGPFGLLAEYVESTQDLRVGTATATTARGAMRNDAWQVTASYALTGESESYHGIVRPKSGLNEGGYGAFEFALRAASLSIDNAAFPLFADPTVSARRATTYAGGVNWYATANTKIYLDYDLTNFLGGATAGHNREVEKALFGRIQVAF